MKNFSLCFIAVCILLFFATNVIAETLFLKNGKIYQGSIVSKVKYAILFKDKKDGKCFIHKLYPPN